MRLTLPLTLAIAVATACGAYTGVVHAADRAKAEQLVQVTGIGENFQGMQQQLMQAAAQRYMMAAQQAGLDETQVASGRPAMEAVFEQIQRTLDWDAMKPEVVGIYTEIFTEAEMDAAISFYTSPAGRSFIEKQEPLMERAGAIADQRVEAAMPQLQAAIQSAVEAAAASTPAPAQQD